MAASILRWSCVAVALKASLASRQTDVLSLVQTKAVTLEKTGHTAASDSVKDQVGQAIAQSNEDEYLEHLVDLVAKKKFEVAVPQATARQAKEPRNDKTHFTTALWAKGTNDHLDVSSPASGQAKQLDTDTDTSELSDMSTLLRESDRVSANISSTMAVLEMRLGEAHNQSVQEVTIQRAEYEAKLQAQKAESHATELMNAHLAVKVYELRKANTQLRTNAELLANETKILKSDIQDMRDDVNGAADFANASMQLSEVMLHGAKELKVVSELSEQDDKLAHQKLLDAIGGVHMLQGRKQPAELVQSLMSSLGNFSNEQNVSKTVLTDTFQKKFHAGVDKQKVLLEKSAKLKEMWESEQQLHERLDIAIKHLQKAREQLIQQEKAIAAFIAFGRVAGAKDTGSLLEK